MSALLTVCQLRLSNGSTCSNWMLRVSQSEALQTPMTMDWIEEKTKAGADAVWEVYRPEATDRSSNSGLRNYLKILTHKYIGWFLG